MWKVLEETPPQPSRRAKSEAADRLSVIAMRRGLKPDRLGAALRGDLDWIALKCLEKDRQRRYDTVGALALDLRHHLENRPVRARPPDGAYLLGRAIRRNRLAFALGAVSVTALLVGALVSSGFFLRERSARIQSEKLRREAELARDSATKARNSSEEMIAWILRDLRPGFMALGRLDLLESIGITVEGYYKGLPPGDHSAATQLRHCEILFLNANVLFQRNELHKAIKLYEEGLGIVERVVAEEPDNDLAARLHLAFVTTMGDALGGQGHPAECLVMRRRSVELARVLAAGAPSDSMKQRALCISLRKLGQVLMSDGQGDAARATMDECGALSARTCPGHLPFVLQIQGDWQREAGWHQTAIRTYRRAIAGFAKLEDEAPDNIHALRYGVQCHIAMARSLFRIGRKEDACDELTTARRISGRFRRIDPTNGDVMGDLASISHVSGMFHSQEGDDARAEADFREALGIFAGLSRKNPAFVAWHDALVRLSVSADELAAKPGVSRSARVLAADVHLTAGECRSLGRQMEHARAALIKARPFVEELMREAAEDAVCQELDRRLRALASQAGGQAAGDSESGFPNPRTGLLVQDLRHERGAQTVRFGEVRAEKRAAVVQEIVRYAIAGFVDEMVRHVAGFSGDF
jgi:tetratricopeptide (TPR) repeat protein